MKKTLLAVIAGVLLNAGTIRAEEKIAIGVSTALTGDAASFGSDIKNALIVANDTILGGRYRFIFEDEQCKSKEAISAAQKFIGIDKVRYVLGFPCNQTLLTTAPIYEKAGVTVITSSATSGDELDIGKHIFRLFPSDLGAAEKLFEYASKRSTGMLILTEQDQFPAMMERTFLRLNEKDGGRMKILTKSFVHGETDLRSLFLGALKPGIDSIFINTNTETSYIAAVKQLHALKMEKTLYGAYHPASLISQASLGAEVEGIIFSNLATSDQIATASGKKLMADFRARFGNPQAGFPVIPITAEALRLLDLAIQSGEEPSKFLYNRKVTDGLIPEYRFDEHGAVQGISFEMQKIENGKIVVLHE